MDKWSEAWHLRFNSSKYSVLPVGSRNIDRYHYNLGGTNLNYTDSEKDIGVIIHKNLSFEEHMSTQVNKANRILGLIRQTFTYLDKDTFLKLYKALVRPRLEFSNAVWSPFLVKDITLIENVQRRATRLLPGFKDEDYTTRLRNLNLPTLVYRRLRGDMIELYKMAYNIYDSDLPQLFDFNNTSRTRGHSKKLKVYFAKKYVRSNFFTRRVVGHWNSLPDHVISAPTLNSFKTRLDEHWASQPMIYDFRASLDTKKYVELNIMASASVQYLSIYLCQQTS